VLEFEAYVLIYRYASEMEKKMREIPTNKLNRKIISAWRIGGLIGTLFWALIIAGCVVLLNILVGKLVLWLTIGIAILAAWVIGYVIIVPLVRYNRWRYDVNEDEVDLYHGVIVRKRIIIPLVRVQFTDTAQGPIMKSFGLAQVTVNTAGGEQTIPGLLDEDADALRDKVARLASLAREEV
jgi:membrane protein YdbS with pleckstrin-like domain